MQSKAKTVAEYLEELPDERRPAISRIRAAIRKNLPKGFVECMNYGMIGYVVPHKQYPAGYHVNPKDPLPFAALASQKNHLAFYLMTLYQKPGTADWLRERFQAAGRKLDMGKSCIRFRKIDDVPLDIIGEAVSRVSMADFIARYENR